MGRLRGRLTCSTLVSPSYMRILRDLINGLGKGIQTMILLIEAGRKLLRDRRHTLIDLA